MRSLGLALCILVGSSLSGSAVNLDVVVDGSVRAEYSHRGSIYVEAIRGREFSLRISNPTPYRVAVALSVDGLNTIDAKHTDGWSASKWVLDPYETTEISGWQVNDRDARLFFFTGERSSYGAAIGKTENLGVIEAIFYRERPARVRPMEYGLERDAAGALAPSVAAESAAPRQKARADDFAATGMGDRTRHEVTHVDLVLDPQPIASARIRYEFRPQLVKLGVLPAVTSRLERRERARGFESYCPEPD